jgi:nucleoside-diphosphate-sugar epimerase
VGKRVLLLGGGYCLARLASELSCEEFIITSRSAEKVAEFSRQGFNAVVLDLQNREAVQTLFAEYGEFEIVLDSIPPYLIENSYAQYLEDLGYFLSLGKKGRFKRACYLSTVGVFGRTDGAVVHEETKCTPFHERGKVRLQAEERYIQSNVPSFVLRLSGIYGPGRGLAKRIQSGMYPANFNRKKWSNRIHLEDIVSVLKAVVDCEGASSAAPGVYCVTDDTPAPLGEVIKFYCQELGIELKTKAVEQGVSEGKRARFALNQRVCNDKMKRELLSTLQYPSYREGVTTTSTRSVEGE